MKRFNTIFQNIRNRIKKYKDDKKRNKIELKYKTLFELLDLDWNGYLALQRLKNKELLNNGL